MVVVVLTVVHFKNESVSIRIGLAKKTFAIKIEEIRKQFSFLCLLNKGDTHDQQETYMKRVAPKSGHRQCKAAHYFDLFASWLRKQTTNGKMKDNKGADNGRRIGTEEDEEDVKQF